MENNGGKMEAKQEFIEIFKENVKRPGAEKLLEWLCTSDFFTAPASTKYHCAFEGGLVHHSLNVYKTLKKRCDEYGITDGESVAICGLLHDICKANFYTISYRNAKNERGQWEKVPYYTVDDQFPFGHGEKSVFVIERFHAYEKYPLAVLLHMADLESTYLAEQGEFKKL